jgi:hypothetical protein
MPPETFIPKTPVINPADLVDPSTRATTLRQITRAERALREAKSQLMANGVNPSSRNQAKRALWNARAELEALSL